MEAADEAGVNLAGHVAGTTQVLKELGTTSLMEAERKAAREEVMEQYCVVAFLASADMARYGDLLTKPENDYTTGRLEVYQSP